MERIKLFPSTARTDTRGHLYIGECDTVSLVEEFGTPLYLFDEVTLRSKCAAFKQEFTACYPQTRVVYACKAFINRALAAIIHEEGLGLDVVSGGELGIAQQANFPMPLVYFHGNNKSAAELIAALGQQIGRVVVDNFHELEMLDRIAGEMGVKQDILLRLTPGIDPHTHRYISTGNIDSKFGFPLAIAADAVKLALAADNLNLVGLHSHVGSLIGETEPYTKAIEVILGFAAEMKKVHGFELAELGVGGGYPVAYTTDDEINPLADYARAISSAITGVCRQLDLELPLLTIEPGRAIVAQAGVALYTVGVVKDIPGVRCYASVDGGMADNIRPALYSSRYEAIIANKALEQNTRKLTVSGKFCESGDILIKDIMLPELVSGDIIAIPVSGAYCLPMASNYNSALKPPVVLLNDGKVRLIRRRETLEDLTRCDLL